MASLGSHSECLEEDFDDGHSASSEVRILAGCPQKSRLILLDKGSVKVALLEHVDGEGATQELDIGGQADDMIVLKRHIESLNSLLS